MTSYNEVNTCKGNEAPGSAESAGCEICSRPCISRSVSLKLRESGLRPTRQRVQLARLLFSGGDRHFTAEALYTEAVQGGISVSVATVYNTLQQFTNAGLLRRLASVDQKAWFDTNLTEHHHMFFEDDGRLTDIPEGYLSLGALPPVPEGMEIMGIDVVVRLRKRTEAK